MGEAVAELSIDERATMTNMAAEVGGFTGIVAADEKTVEFLVERGLSRAEAETFYGVHRERPFFGELVEMMTAAPVVVQVLEGENAIAKYREVMGATNPEKAAPGTIRKQFALSMGENSVHGSDAPETAAQEIAQWFAGNEIVG